MSITVDERPRHDYDGTTPFTRGGTLRVALAVAGSMSFQGEVIGWVATHRRHHAFTDRPGDPHSFGESWHNMHHSDPACARHGAEPGQIDISAAVIRLFERLGWATGVHWPVPARLAARRNPGRDQPQSALQPGGRWTERAAIPGRRLPQLPVRSDRLA